MAIRLFFFFFFFVSNVLGQQFFPSEICYGPPQPVPIQPPYSANLQSALQDLQQNLARWAQEGNFPSLAANLVVRDNVIWSYGYGKKNLTDPTSGPPDGDTIYRVGSVTKIFTALLLRHVRDQGGVNLDDPITKLFPDFSVINPWPCKKQITLRQLSSHTSGLQREGPCTPGGSCPNTTAEVLAGVAKGVLVVPPGTQALYSNLGFSILGRSLETVTKKTWESSLTDNIFHPLGMVNSYPTWSEQIPHNFAVGYGGNPPVDIGHATFGWFSPSGEAYSTTNDLGKLLSWIFRSYNTYSGVDTLGVADPDTVREWLQVVDWKTVGISSPWETYPWGNYTLLTKPGGVNGYGAMIGFIPELAIGFSVVISTLPLSMEFTYAWEGLANFLVDHLEPELWALQPPDSLPSDVNQFVGNYSNEFFTYQIVLQPFGRNKKPALLAINVNIGFEQYPVIRLERMPNNGDSFRWSFRDIIYDCQALTMGLFTFDFKRDSYGKVISFDFPGLFWGTPFVKQQSSSYSSPKAAIKAAIKDNKGLKKNGREQGILSTV